MSKLNKYKHPGAKRLMLEALELKDNTEDYCAQPLDDNLVSAKYCPRIFRWHPRSLTVPCFALEV